MTFQLSFPAGAVPPATVQFFPGGWIQMNGSSTTACGNVPALLSPGEYVIPATAAASTTATAAVSWAVQYIASTYGGAVDKRGVRWRARPLTMREMLG